MQRLRTAFAIEFGNAKLLRIVFESDIIFIGQ